MGFMTLNFLLLLLPYLVLVVTIVVVLLTIAFYRQHALIAGLSLVGITASFLSLTVAWQQSPGSVVSSLLLVDHIGLLFTGILLLATFIVILMSYAYLQKLTIQPEEYYLLLLLATLGGSILVVSNHFASLFLSLEILSVSLYGLIGYLRGREESIEAAIKYLILAGISVAFMMFGVALIYTDQGTLVFNQLVFSSGSDTGLHNVLMLTGFGMFFVGVGFKLAVVPFHMWTPDVYQGAPVPISGYVATISKGAMFALLLRLSIASKFLEVPVIVLVLTVIAVLSMLVGNLLALLQNNVKRILAYSSIAHLGYLLVALLANTGIAIVAATFYIMAYFVTTLGAFGIISVMSDPTGDADEIDDYRGLFWRRPWLAGIFSLALFSLIGIPLTAGFVGKFLVLTAGVGATKWLLAIVLVVSSAISLYYYLKIIVAMFREPEGEVSSSMKEAPITLPSSLVLGGLILLLLWLGLYPTPLITMIQSAISGL
jgi:NADH-quinone oxidoreductase subunit N